MGMIRMTGKVAYLGRRNTLGSWDAVDYIVKSVGQIEVSATKAVDPKERLHIEHRN